MEPSWMVRSDDGSRIAGFELGGSGDALLIAHATGFCGPAYRRLARHLTDSFRVVTFDFRAHGRSQAATGLDVSWERMTEDLLAVIEQVGEPVHGFGHSMGGAVSLTAASRVPTAFTSLFLFEPIVFVEPPPAGTHVALSEIARRRRSRFESRPEVLARYAANPPFDGVLAGCLHDYVEHGFVDVDGGGVELACSPQHEAEIFQYGVASTVAVTGSTSVPATIAVGHDHEGPALLGQPLQAFLPSARLIRYPGIDHLGPFQDPATVAADIVTYAP